MIKIVVINCWFATNEARLNEHDEKINQILTALQEKDCSYISHHTFMLFEKLLRTEIVYRENETRKVLIEKHK